MKLSIIVPVYNTEHYLAEAIDSLLAQTRQIDEIIVVDDGSTDSSGEIAQSFAEVKYHAISHGGPAAARNAGIALSSGDIIGFHDADDICFSHRIETQMKALSADMSKSFCLSMIQNFIEPGQEVPQSRISTELLSPRLGFISSAIVRRAVFDRVGLFNEEYMQGEDIEWMYRAKLEGEEYVLCEEVLIRRRLHEANISHEIAQGHKSLFKAIRELKKS